MRMREHLTRCLLGMRFGIKVFSVAISMVLTVDLDVDLN